MWYWNRQTENGKFKGFRYWNDEGVKIYEHHMMERHRYQRMNAWCLDMGLLRKCKTWGATIIVIRCKRKSVVCRWVASIDDFTGPASFPHQHRGNPQRGLPLPAFRIDPLKNPEVIDRLMTLPNRK